MSGITKRSKAVTDKELLDADVLAGYFIVKCSDGDNCKVVPVFVYSEDHPFWYKSGFCCYKIRFGDFFIEMNTSQAAGLLKLKSIGTMPLTNGTLLYEYLSLQRNAGKSAGAKLYEYKFYEQQ